MTTIIGIDPGSLVTGYGVIVAEGNRLQHVASGTISVKTKNLSEKLHDIFLGIREIIQIYKPEESSVEEVFFHKNPNSALKLGQARGAAITAIAFAKIPVAEYSPREIKLSVVGYGAAQKTQVQHMIKALLNIRETLQADAADALAVAICHAHHRSRKYDWTSNR